MNHSFGTTDIAKPEPSDASHILEIDEADIRLLGPYEDESDGRTLVGLGPVSRASAAEKAENAPLSQQPSSQMPGPWGSSDDAIPASMRGKKLGIWGVAIPLLLVVAGVAIVFLRALGSSGAPSSRSTLSVAPPVERDEATLAVQLSGADVRVFLDGQDHGRPPLLLRGLAPGSHALAILGPSFAPFEQPVTLVNDRVSTLEPKLVFVRGSISLSAGTDADGAKIEVVGADERREIEALPLRLEAAPGEYQIRAKKSGFPPFETSVTLAPATPDVAVVIELGKTTESSVPHGVKPETAAAGSGKPNNESDAAASTDDAAPSSASGTSSLNITSSPPSNVVLDGRPLGKAPRVVDVTAGTHTVVFIHPKYGRQSLTVNALPGRTTSASADF